MALTGSSRGQSQPQRTGDGVNPVRDASNLAPEPSGRTDLPVRADDLRATAATSRPGRYGSRYLAARVDSSQVLLRRRVFDEAVRDASSGVVPRERSVLVPDRGGSLRFPRLLCFSPPSNVPPARLRRGWRARLVRLKWRQPCPFAWSEEDGM